MLALFIHQIVADVDRNRKLHLARATFGPLFLQSAQDLQSDRIVGTDHACAMAVRAGLCRGLQHAGTQALTRHFQQAEARNPAKLNPRTIVLECVFQAFFHGSVVLALVHVDEVDDNQTGQIAQPHLAGYFVGSLQVGLGGGIFDRAFLGRLARVDVDRDQRLGDTDDDIAAGFQLHGRVEHARQIRFDTILGEQRLAALRVQLHVLRMGRHDQFHVVLGIAIPGLALDDDFVDVAIIQVPDRPVDQVALFVDRGGRD